MPSSSRGKFVELANTRVNGAIKTIRLIGNLSNRSNYSYTESDVEKVFAALRRELRAAERRFRSTGKGESSVFQLE